MKVQEIILSNGEKSFLVLDEEGIPIESIMKYMKYLNSIRKSPNTQRAYCYGLRDFYICLSLVEIDYKKVNTRIFSNYLSWLVNPTLLARTIHLTPPKLKSEKTINLRMTAVFSFYRFLYQFEYIEDDVLEKVYKERTGPRNYKDFLYHINRHKSVSQNIFKLKETRKKPKVIPDEIIKVAFEKTCNERDYFLLSLLLESGLRIGEILSLRKKDIIYDLVNGHRIQLSYHTEMLNNARLKTGPREIYISSNLIDLFDNYMYFISDFDKTDFLLVKLKGKNKGLGMEYQDVSSLFKRLEKKINYHIHPHLFRHTHATKYFEKTNNIKIIQERLGHKQIQTTMNLYLHPSAKEVRRQWEKAKSSFDMEEL